MSDMETRKMQSRPLTFKMWSIVWLAPCAVLIATQHPGWAAICLLLWASWPLSKSDEQATALQKTVQPDYSFKNEDGTKWTFDIAGGRIATRKGNKVRILDRDDILAVDVERNGTSVQKINKGGSITGAFVGALVGGGAGAVMGYTGTGTSTIRTEESLRELSLRITINDAASPFLRMSFFKAKKDVPAEKQKVVSAVEKMELWRARFAILLAGKQQKSSEPV